MSKSFLTPCPFKKVSAFFVSLLLISGSSFAQNSQLHNTPGNGEHQPKSKEKFSLNPFDHPVFIENLGQFDKKDGDDNSQIKFGARRGDIQVYFTPSGLSYRMDEFSKDGEEEREAAQEKVMDGGKKRPDKITPHFVHLEWLGANPNTEITGEEKVDYFFTYPDVNDATFRRVLFRSAFQKILYKDLYPNIDVEYTLPGTIGDGERGIKYTIILHPGADPSLIQMKYTGEGDPGLVNGEVKIDSRFMGLFTDHKPVSFYESGQQPIASDFIASGKTISFHLENYDASQTVIIDPYSTNPNFTSYNAAYDLEYDLNGNAYVYGGNWPWQEIKLNSAGAIQWVYNASLFYSAGCSGPCYGDFAVDATSGSAYLVEGFNGGSGTRVIKVNKNGAQVAVFPGNNNFGEMWRIVYNNCAHKSVIAGGGTSATYQACVLDTNCSSMTPVNVLNSVQALHDMNLLALDNNNMCYMATARSLSYSTTYNNIMIQVNGTTLTPQVWNVSDGYAFAEVSTIPYVNGVTSDANGFNGMAVSPNFLYTYDGSTLKKWNKGTGALIASVSVSGTPYAWGGIDVDDCDNIYVGCQSSVKKYNVSLSLVSTFAFANTIFDVRLGPNNTLFAAGLGFVGAQTLSTICNPLNTVMSTTSNCTSGTATVTVTGGTGPYTYSWSPTNQTTATATGLSTGTYTVTVRDNSCVPKIKTDTITVHVGANMTVTTTQVNVLCNGSCTATATANPSGGTAPYTYSWNSAPVQTTQTATGLCAGSYTVTVTDAGGCTHTTTVTITQPTVLTATTTQVNVLCNGACTGTATVTAGGGTPGYTYSWTTTPSQSTVTATGLCAGSYTVTVRDANNCTRTATVTITQPTALSASATSTQSTCSASNGTATVTASGGTPGYTYSWNTTPTQTTATATGLPAGNYTVTVTDANG